MSRNKVTSPTNSTNSEIVSKLMTNIHMEKKIQIYFRKYNTDFLNCWSVFYGCSHPSY